jgi:hypothetical protein
MFRSKAGDNMSEAPFRRSTLGQAPCLSRKFRLSWKVTNTLSYLAIRKIRRKKFYKLGYDVFRPIEAGAEDEVGAFLPEIDKANIRSD